ncbi:cytochrome P460 family protein [Kordiimonas laminariae]|uniref:cytochrome P460 family protein n=1 Tax=Kordiimonas laminariae TaxID=2917717 RepID=UPI001FF601FC|nr:cytochrome P460 family protein [Kordiimonas laminariae]MCK0069984.1 cytochrome P460 family protein [Kordiimonas laminariae]
MTNLEKKTVKTWFNMKAFVLAGLSLCAVTIGAAAYVGHGDNSETYIGEATYEKLISAKGDIRVPKNFRTDYVMLGSWSVAGDADTGGEVGLHIVYSTREAVDAYRKTGEFPDGTIIVKELFSGHTEFLTTGEATRADKLAGYFVMIKDGKGRFAENPLWGEGWGWAFFGADNTEKTQSTNYQEDCMACHEPARKTDFIYTDAYPVLKK